MCFNSFAAVPVCACVFMYVHVCASVRVLVYGWMVEQMCADIGFVFMCGC